MLGQPLDGLESTCMYECAMRAELIGHFKPCMTDIYLHIDARMADYIRTAHKAAAVLTPGCQRPFELWRECKCAHQRLLRKTMHD